MIILLNAFYKSNSSSLNALKLLKIVLVVLFAFMIAVLPAVRAYAMSIEATLIGALAGTLLATAIGTAGVTAVVAILIGMGFSCTVSMLYDYFNDSDNVSSFLAAWDNFTANHQFGVNSGIVSLSGPAFNALYALVKSYIVNGFEETVSPDLGDGYPLLNCRNSSFYMNINADTTSFLNALPSSDKFSFYAGDNASIDIDFENSVTGWSSTVHMMYNGKFIWYTYQDSNYHIKIKSKERMLVHTGNMYPTLIYPYVYNNYLFFPVGWASVNKTFEDRNWYFTYNFGNYSNAEMYWTQDDLNYQTSTDVRVYQNNTSICYNDTDGVRHIYSIKLPDGTVINSFDGQSQFLYYLLCTECELIDSTTNTSINNSIGTTSQVINNYYTTENDTLYNYYSQTSAAEAAGTLATGTDSDVKISTAALTSSVVGTDVLTETAALTNVESNVQTTSGEVISISPALTCMNGINLIRVSSGTIRDKFPFAVVYVLRDSLKVFEGTRETPVITIPLRFNIGQLISIDEDFTVDLSNLNTIAAIVRWGELGGLGIALAILTKRLLF